ncbi:uncharacterized protein LOC126990831 [Eriocheir sinensis]|uniref:uncharacterized protein LOC126990831 n=1 Tax=Eriocheir sinensis TaxID=95602 RepID=UPI0021C9D832|nr:uncharacterized protein LOC126990831 [Eriocheir sinensis]
MHTFLSNLYEKCPHYTLFYVIPIFFCSPCFPFIAHSQEETTGPGGGGGEEGEEVEGKRKVRTPRALQEQFWLQKQRPKPVCSVEVEKKHKSSLSTCKYYKFSSEANLRPIGSATEAGREGRRGASPAPSVASAGICHTYKTCTQQRLLVHQKTCGKGSKQSAQLLNHQGAHITDPKDMPAWADKAFCEECQKWFRDRKSFQKHNTLGPWARHQRQPLTPEDKEPWGAAQLASRELTDTGQHPGRTCTEQESGGSAGCRPGGG